jgi:DegV family protein with EDD domain
MAQVVVVTDSTADIPRSVREKLGIEIVPLVVHFGDEAYLDNVELSPEAFYRKLRMSAVLPKTSQPSPAQYFELYERLVGEGKTVVSIHLSSAMSGTCQSARIAQSMLEGKGDVTVIDSRSASYGYGMGVVAAAERAAQGASKEEVIAAFERVRREMRLYFLVDTLEYLHKGGRIGRAAALFGTLLHIKPILTIDDDGYVAPLEKARGTKRAVSRIAELLEPEFGGRPVELAMVDTPGQTEMADRLKELLLERLDVRRFFQSEIGPVIGTHAGPGTVGVFVIGAPEAGGR